MPCRCASASRCTARERPGTRALPRCHERVPPGGDGVNEWSWATASCLSWATGSTAVDGHGAARAGDDKDVCLAACLNVEHSFLFLDKNVEHRHRPCFRCPRHRRMAPAPHVCLCGGLRAPRRASGWGGETKQVNSNFDASLAHGLIATAQNLRAEWYSVSPSLTPLISSLGSRFGFEEDDEVERRHEASACRHVRTP